MTFPSSLQMSSVLHFAFSLNCQVPPHQLFYADSIQTLSTSSSTQRTQAPQPTLPLLTKVLQGSTTDVQPLSRLVREHNRSSTPRLPRPWTRVLSTDSLTQASASLPRKPQASRPTLSFSTTLRVRDEYSTTYTSMLQTM